MVRKWQFLIELLRVETLRRGSLTVLIASVLRSCGIELGCATSRMKMRTPLATRSLANGHVAIVRIEYAARSDGRMKLMGVRTVEDVDWTLQAVTDHLMDALKGTDDDAAPGAPDGAVNKRAGEHAKGWVSRVAVPPSHEIQVYVPVVFTVVMKVAGVEKARVTAYSDAGPERT